jgi:hypothetical protein
MAIEQIIGKRECQGTSFLGKKIKIKKTAEINIFSPHTVEYFVDVVEVLIGIGNDHTASLIMTVDAWETFKNIK